MRIGAWMLLAAGLAALTVADVAADATAPAERRMPYFASISATRARMRVGPGRTYPASWLYQRADLPVKVLDHYDKGLWLKVEDPEGTQGWMLAALVSSVRTAMVMGAVAELKDTPRFEGKRLWRVEPGVVGRISKCASGWCWFDVHGRGGYVEANRLWGVEPGETLN